MKLGKQKKIKPKTDEECEKEIDDIISGKKKGLGANIVRKWIKGRKLVEPMESIRLNLIAEYKAKYGALSSGKTSLTKIGKDVGLDVKEKK